MEGITLYNIGNINNAITYTFKEKLWCAKELDDKRKLSYYKEVIKLDLEDQQYISILTRVKNKINIVELMISIVIQSIG